MNRPCLFALAAALLACAHAEPLAAPPRTASPGPSAGARIEPSSGSMVRGLARFEPADDGRRVSLVLELDNLPPGEHAVHLYENGDCTSPDALSAGEHWNPLADRHGRFEHAPSHLGDIGNVEADGEGHARLEAYSRAWSIGTQTPTDVVGRAIVVHEREDDLTSQPSGNAGLRIACGVVEAMPAHPRVSSRARAR